MIVHNRTEKRQTPSKPAPSPTPLLKGVLTRLDDWRATPASGRMRRDAILTVWCSTCRRRHDHIWQLDGPESAYRIESRPANCPAGEYAISPWSPGDHEFVLHGVDPERRYVRELSGLHGPPLTTNLFQRSN